MRNSTAAPTQTLQFNSKIVQFNAMGVKADFPGGGLVGSKNNIDLPLADDHFITGGSLVVTGAAFGDFCDVQVIDPDNMLGAGAGAVLNQFVTKWFMAPGLTRQADFDLPYPAKIYAGLMLRCIYNSFGADPIQAAFNYRLHKAII